jgi:hypothetical protein
MFNTVSVELVVTGSSIRDKYQLIDGETHNSKRTTKLRVYINDKYHYIKNLSNGDTITVSGTFYVEKGVMTISTKSVFYDSSSNRGNNHDINNRFNNHYDIGDDKYNNGYNSHYYKEDDKYNNGYKNQRKTFSNSQRSNYRDDRQNSREGYEKPVTDVY